MHALQEHKSKGTSMQIFGNEERQKIFLDLVHQFGTQKWTEIARALRIHEIIVAKPTDLRYLYARLTNNTAVEFIKPEERRYLIQMSVSAFHRLEREQKWKEVFGETRSIQAIDQYLKREIRRTLLQFIKLFCRKKLELTKQFNTVSLRTFQIQVRLREHLRQVMLLFADHLEDDRGLQYETLSRITTKRQMEQLIEEYKQINVLRLISDKSITNDSQLNEYPIPRGSTIKQLKQTDLHHRLFSNTYFVKMRRQFQEANLDTYKEKQDKQFSVVLDYTEAPKLFKYPKKKSNMITVRGRIRQPGRIEYGSSYCNQFTQDLLLQNQNLSEDEDMQYIIPPDINLQNTNVEQNVEQSQEAIVEMTYEDIINQMGEDEKLKSFIEKHLRDQTLIAYNLYKKHPSNQYDYNIIYISENNINYNILNMQVRRQDTLHSRKRTAVMNTDIPVQLEAISEQWESINRQWPYIKVKSFQLAIQPGQQKTKRILYKNPTNKPLQYELISSMPNILEIVSPILRLGLEGQDKDYIKIKFNAPETACQLYIKVAFLELSSGEVKAKSDQLVEGMEYLIIINQQ